MIQLNITLSEEVLKELMLKNRDEAVTKLLETVFDAVLKAEASIERLIGALLMEHHGQ